MTSIPLQAPAAVRTFSLQLPDSWRWLAPGDARSQLRHSITDQLVVSGAELLHLQTGCRQAFNPLPDNASGHIEAIADAAKTLLGENAGERKLELLLPPSGFLATSQAMPGVNRENLVAAFQLQREAILPACEQDCALAVAGPAQLADEPRITALWFPASQLENWFSALQQRGLNLVAVRPRVLAARAAGKLYSVVDEDPTQLTAVTLEQGVITQWLPIDRVDLQQQDFVEQWESASSKLAEQVSMQAGNADAFEVRDIAGEPDYGFYPQGALQAQQRVEKTRRYLVAAALCAGLLLLSLLPFLLQAFELRMADMRLESTRERSAAARADQAVVANFEHTWGALNDYPQPQLRQAMFRLQELLGDEQLSTLELNEGLMRIQGNSSNPQAILQRLEQDPMFTEVVFSRATSNTRYYIDLRLATVNFAAYMIRYFPHQT